jgi:hypothetical protein
MYCAFGGVKYSSDSDQEVGGPIIGPKDSGKKPSQISV